MLIGFLVENYGTLWDVRDNYRFEVWQVFNHHRLGGLSNVEMAMNFWNKKVIFGGI